VAGTGVGGSASGSSVGEGISRAAGLAGVSTGTFDGTSTADRTGAASGTSSSTTVSGAVTSSATGSSSTGACSAFLAAGSVWIFFSTFGRTVGRGGAATAVALGRPPLEMRTLTASTWSGSKLLSWFLTSYPRSRQ
jgi:hypothetical protein